MSSTQSQGQLVAPGGFVPGPGAALATVAPFPTVAALPMRPAAPTANLLTPHLPTSGIRANNIPTATIPTVVGPARVVPVHHSTEMAIDEGMYPRTGAAAMCPDSRDPIYRDPCRGMQSGNCARMPPGNCCGLQRGNCAAMHPDNCVGMQPGSNPSMYPGNGAGTYPPYEAGAYPGNNFDFQQSMHSRGSFGTGDNASSCAVSCGPGSVWNAAVAASACGCLWDECYDGWSVVGRWLVLADFLMLKRNQSHSVPFATLNNNERVVLATRVQDFPFRPAMRLGVGVPLSPKLRVEGLYFGMANWTETAAVRDATPNALGGTGNLFSRLSDFGIPASTALDYNSLASFAYYSALDNAELNLRHRLPTPPYVEASLLFGGRYISVRERLSFGTQSSVPTSNLVETRAQNDMVGLQIGAALNAPVHFGWWFQGEIKGVLMQNSAAQQTQYTHTDSVSTTTFLGNKSSKVATYAGDLSLWLSYQCSQRFVVRFGYQAFWFDGLALASQNVERNINLLTLGPAQLLHGGRVVYHGPSAGVTFSW